VAHVQPPADRLPIDVRRYDVVNDVIAMQRNLRVLAAWSGAKSLEDARDLRRLASRLLKAMSREITVKKSKRRYEADVKKAKRFDIDRLTKVSAVLKDADKLRDRSVLYYEKAAQAALLEKQLVDGKNEKDDEERERQEEGQNGVPTIVSPEEVEDAFDPSRHSNVMEVVKRAVQRRAPPPDEE